MGLHFIFTVDGDWDEYFSTKLSKAKRRPHRKGLAWLIEHEIRIARFIGGRLLHFVHTSPVAREYFFHPRFIKLWKKIEKSGGSIGVHCHEEGLFSQGELKNPIMLEKSIHSLTEPLRKEGLTLISYRSGYLSFCKSVIPILEKNGILLDFSCFSGRYLHYEGRLIANWRGAPKNYYYMCYLDHCREGESNVVEIPIGKIKKRALYIDVTSLLDIWMIARHLAKKEKTIKGNIIVSLLTHTYEFSYLWKRLRIRAALFICSRYGSFINDKEVLDVIKEEKGMENYENRNCSRK